MRRISCSSKVDFGHEPFLNAMGSDYNERNVKWRDRTSSFMLLHRPCFFLGLRS